MFATNVSTYRKFLQLESALATYMYPEELSINIIGKCPPLECFLYSYFLYSYY